MRPKLWFGTQHHAQWVDAPLSGAEMSPEGWGADGTYLSGGGFVRQSQDSHRQYIFEWSGASSRESAEIMQAYRDGVYSKSRSDLIYFIDPLIYSRNILPKRWAQPGILAPDSGAASTPLGLVSKIDGPGVSGLPLTGAQVSSYFTSVAQFNATTEPQQGSIWLPVPLGETLQVVAWAGDFATQESGLYVKAQNPDGTWRPAERVEGLGVEVSGARGVLLASVGMFNYFGARATIGEADLLEGLVHYAWTGTPNASTSTRTDDAGTVTNLFTNPDMVATSGEVVVWENRVRSAHISGSTAGISKHANVTDLGPDINGRVYQADTSITGSAGIAYPNASGNAHIGDLAAGTPLFARTRVENVGDVPFTVRTRFYWYDGNSGGAAPTDYSDEYEVLPNQIVDLIMEDIPVPAGVDGVSAGVTASASGIPAGAKIKVYDGWYIGEVLAPVGFSEYHSPDPDLTPQPRPGGGSQLVGQRVEGVSPFGESLGDPDSSGVVAVQSTQWSKSRGTSVRIITRKLDSPEGQWLANYVVLTPEDSDFGSLAMWVRQEAEVGEVIVPIPDLEPRTVTLSMTERTGFGILPPNEAGEGLVRVSTDTDNEVPSGSVVTLFGGANIGDSIWIDLVTVTDIENYEGEPFSGNTPGITPEWSPGLGHSGCAFVGNPTWTATSGVNGGQVGYAATLKEVGDWQQ